MKKIILFLSVGMLLLCSTTAMAFVDVGHKNVQKIEISKATPVLEQMAIVNLEAFMVNTAFDVGWCQNSILTKSVIQNVAVMPVQKKLQPNYLEIYDSQFLHNYANNYKLKSTAKIHFYQSYPYKQPTPFLYT